MTENALREDIACLPIPMEMRLALLDGTHRIAKPPTFISLRKFEGSDPAVVWTWYGFCDSPGRKVEAVFFRNWYIQGDSDLNGGPVRTNAIIPPAIGEVRYDWTALNAFLIAEIKEANLMYGV